MAKNLSVKALLSCLKEKEDYELYPYAKKKLVSIYGEEIAELISNVMDPNNKKEEKACNTKHELIDAMNLGEYSEDDINKLLNDIEKTLKEKRMPIGTIMEMYHSGANKETSSVEEKFLYQKSREYVVISYGRYVHSLINHVYSTYAEKMEDELYQCGVIGLLNALQVYDESKGAFTTLCKPYIMHEITNQINFYHNDTTLHYNNLQKKINEAITKLNKEGMEPTVQRISIITEIRPEMVERELKCMECTKFVYLDADQDDKDNNDRACEYEDTPDAIYERKERTECIFASIKSLPNKIREVIALRYEGVKTNEEIANMLNLKIGQVKSYYQRGLRLMRQDSGLRGLFPEFLSNAEKDMMKYDMPINISQKNINNEINDLIHTMNTLLSDDNTNTISDELGSVIESLRA